MYIKFSTLKTPVENVHEITAPAKAAVAEVEAQDTESPDETYEVVEMQVTSKTRYAPAQTPQEGTVKTQPMESEDSAAEGENQEAYVNFD